MKRILALIAVLALVLGAGLYAVAQQPYQLTPMDESKRDRVVPVAGGRDHVLPATLETAQWGWLAPHEKPKLMINSRDTVAVETMMHAHNAAPPGTPVGRILKLPVAHPGR